MSGVLAVGLGATVSLWLLVGAALVVTLTVDPRAINAVLGIGAVAVICTGILVAGWVSEARSRGRRG